MPQNLDNLTDRELAQESQAGLLAAFEMLVRRYEARVYRFCLSLSRTPEDAAEATQDSFVRAFQAIAQFDPGQEFLPWLFTIARRKCIDRLRMRSYVAEGQIPEAAAPDDPASVMSANEDRAGLWGFAKRSLPETQYQALWLRYAEDLSVPEIARVLGKSYAHVKVLLFRARHTLGRKIHSVSRLDRATAGVRLASPFACLYGLEPLPLIEHTVPSGIPRKEC